MGVNSLLFSTAFHCWLDFYAHFQLIITDDSMVWKLCESKWKDFLIVELLLIFALGMAMVSSIRAELCRHYHNVRQNNISDYVVE